MIGSKLSSESIFRYRGFLFIQHSNESWLVRPERSPMRLLPFRSKKCSSKEIKAILDSRLLQQPSFDSDVVEDQAA